MFIDNNPHIFLMLSRCKYILKLVVVAFIALLVMSCGKSNYPKDDIYDGSPKKHTKVDVPKADDGWSSLDIKLGKGDNKALYHEIKDWLGTPYCYAGDEKGKGADCSGFVMQVFLKVYKKPLERNSAKIFEKNCKEISRSNLKEGDLVFFHGKNADEISHVGIYLKDGHFAHASSSKGVIINSLSQRYYDTHFHCAGRVR